MSLLMISGYQFSIWLHYAIHNGFGFMEDIKSNVSEGWWVGDHLRYLLFDKNLIILL